MLAVNWMVHHRNPDRAITSSFGAYANQNETC